MNKEYGWNIRKTPHLYYILLENIFWKELENNNVPRKSGFMYWSIANRWGEGLVDTSNHEKVINCKYTNNLSIIEHRHQIKRFVTDIVLKEIKEQINNPVNNAVGWKI